jgi:glycosyltransferase involved in cell wall biosynthesis
MEQVFDQRPRNWSIIPHGEYGFFSPCSAVPRADARQELGLGRGPHILFFGALRRYKGLDVLLDAMACVRQQVPDARLVIAGAPGLDVQVESFKKQADRLGIADAVIWHTEYIPYDRVHLYFHACDVVALPYRKVYDSGVLKIAQALGCPAVVTDVGGLAAAVAEGRAGRIVAPESTQSLCNALIDLIEDPEQARVLAERGRELARTEYSWDTVAEQTIRFYDAVLNTCVS